MLPASLQKLICCLTIFFFATTTNVAAASYLDKNFDELRTEIVQLNALNSEEHLPHAWVNSIEQDSLGFIWFATQGGVSRYDGVSAKLYSFDLSSANGLKNSFVWDIYNDSEDRLWLAGKGGIHLYIPEVDQFAFFSSDDETNLIKGSEFLKIKESPNKDIWFASRSNGFTRFDNNTNKFVHHPVSTKNDFDENSIVDFTFDQKGNLWVAYLNGYLTNYRIGADNSFVELINIKEQKFASPHILTPVENSDIWIGTRHDGLFVLNTDGVVKHHFTNDDDSRCFSGITSISPSNKNFVWVGSDSSLCKVDIADYNVQTVKKENSDGELKYIEKTKTLKVDNGGVVWVGTESGAYFWNSSISYFSKYTINSASQIMPGNTITSFTIDNNSNLYIGTFGTGLAEVNLTSGKALFHNRDNENTVPESSIMSLHTDSRGTVWVGTQHSGLYLIKGDNQDPLNITASQQAGSISGNAISRILELKSKKIAISTYGNGLNIFDYDTAQFYQPKSISEDVNSSFISDLSEDSKGRLWLATFQGGLQYFEPSTDSITRFKFPEELVTGDDILGVLATKEAIWLTTNGYGVIKLDSKDLFDLPSYKTYNQQNGLAANITYSLVEDDSGNVWVSHAKGLSRINPKTSEILNFNTTHGLQGTDFNQGAYYKAPNGRLFFGGPNGFNTFMPKDIPVNTYQPPLRLVGFSHANTPMPIQQMLREDGVLELNYKDTLVDFEFAALDYTKPSGNQYRYMLKGYKDVWSNQGNNNHISVPYLSPGDYSLVVQGSNNEGIWSEPLEIEIEVLPPIYQTWYAYMAYSLIALLGLLSILRQQQIKHQRQLSHERRLHQLAYYDSLTGLPNRQSFYENLEKFISLAKRGNYQAGVMFIDLDRFKRINDTLGHHYGDKVLQEVAIRLKESVRESDFIARNYHIDTFNNNELARLGGDEFTLFLSQIESPEETSAVTQRIIESLSKPIIIDNYELTVTPSIGIAMYPENGSTVHELMKHADIAMYQAKEDGRRTFKFYSSNLNTRALERLQLEEQMRNALKNNEFQLYYQPQVDLQSNKITKAEALIRWIHPELGFVSPADFIPIAEESGLIIELGDWILETACSQAKAWQTQGLSGCRVSINVSSVQFKQTALIDKVHEALEKTGLPPHLLELEITESAVMSDVEDNIERLQQFKKMGISVAVDDFGTGYSSLSYLKLFPIDTLKIDRSFVDDIATDENDVAIVKAIMVLAEAMDLKVVAEGIETMEQLKILHTFGCQQIQGYFFSRPLPVDQFRQFVTHDFHQDKAMWKLDMVG